MNLGENIYRLRTGKGMSQDALANALEVSRQSVSKWENNSAVPELEKLMKMASIFGVTLDELVGRADAAPQSPAPAPAVTPAVPPHRTLGIILLCFGLAADLLLSILGGFGLGVLAGLPFIASGCILMSSTKEPLFRTAWGLFAVYAPIVYFVMLNFVGFGLRIKVTVIAVWLAALVVWALCLHRRGKLSKESRRFVIASLILSVIVSILVSIGSAIYYFRTDLNSATQELDSYVTEIEPE